MNSVLKISAIATAIMATSIVSSHATILYPPAGDFGLLSIPGIHSLPIAGIASNPLNDLFTFELDQTDAVSIKFGSSYASPVEIISNFTGTLYDGTPIPANFITSNTAVLAAGSTPTKGGLSGLVTATLGAGSYSFTLTGTTADSPAYGGAISIAISSVPLPASLPMFGGALLALAGFGYCMNRWVAPKKAAMDA